MVGVGRVNSSRADLVEALTFARDGVRQFDDIHDLGAAEAGDLHGSHGVRLGPAAIVSAPWMQSAPTGCTGITTAGPHRARRGTRRQPRHQPLRAAQLAIRIRRRAVRARARGSGRAPGTDGRSRAAQFLAHRRIGVVGLRYPWVVRDSDVGSRCHGCVVLRGDALAIHAVGLPRPPAGTRTAIQDRQTCRCPSVARGTGSEPCQASVHRLETRRRNPAPLSWLSRQAAVGVGAVDSCRTHLVELLAIPRDGSGRSTMSRPSGPPKWVICTAHMYGGDVVPFIDLGPPGRLPSRRTCAPAPQRDLSHGTPRGPLRLPDHR
jgi:hypothetical protein